MENCPTCGTALEFDEVDIGVGTLRGNPGCPNCGWRPEPFLDAGLGRELAEEAIEAVEDHADEAWKASAEAALYTMAKTHRHFTTDQVWEHLHTLGCAPPRERRAMGPLMRRGVSNGWIRQTDRMEKTGQPAAHRRPKQIWESLIWEG